MTIQLLVSAVVAGVLQHLVHESSHIVMARLQGVSIQRVHWLTYAGIGTRVFYRDEPATNQEPIDRKWGLIALGGLMGTTLVGYLLLLLYQWGADGLSAWPVFLLFAGSVIFLVTDPLYFFLGAILGFGDVTGVMKAFHIRKRPAIILSAVLLSSAALAVARVWYAP